MAQGMSLLKVPSICYIYIKFTQKIIFMSFPDYNLKIIASSLVLRWILEAEKTDRYEVLMKTWTKGQKLI